MSKSPFLAINPLEFLRGMQTLYDQIASIYSAINTVF